MTGQAITLNSAGGDGYHVRIVEYAKGLRQPVHTHERASVTLVLRGVIEETQEDHTGYAEPFSVIVKAAGIPHSDLYGPAGCKTLQISLPCEFELGEYHLPRARVTYFDQGGPALWSLIRLLKAMQRSSKPDQSEIEFTLCEVIAGLSLRRADTDKPPRWLVRVKDLIDSSPPLSSWSLRDIQIESGIHPVHITRQFHRYYGHTIRDYLKRRRIRAAVALVAESSLSLTEVAHQFAYADQAHFCRAFRAMAQLTASDYRRLVRSSASREVEIVQSVGSTSLQA